MIQGNTNILYCVFPLCPFVAILLNNSVFVPIHCAGQCLVHSFSPVESNSFHDMRVLWPSSSFLYKILVSTSKLKLYSYCAILIIPTSTAILESTPSIRKYLSSKWIKEEVSRRILVLDTFIFIHFDDKYFRTEGVFKICYSTPHVFQIVEKTNVIISQCLFQVSLLFCSRVNTNETCDDHLFVLLHLIGFFVFCI